MYRNFSPTSLGISCRQGELIELALTYGFDGLDLDLVDFQAQVEAKGFDAAARLLQSAKVRLIGQGLPIELAGADGKFESEFQLAQPLLTHAQRLGMTVVRAVVGPGHAQRPYHENFEFHRTRLLRYAELLEPYGLRLALGFAATPAHREGLPQPFITRPDELVTLVKLVDLEQVGLSVDLWDWVVADRSVEELLPGVPLAKILELRLADLPEGLEPAAAVDADRVLPRPGGAVPCGWALDHLLSRGFEGAVTLAPAPGKVAAMKREQIVKTAVAGLDELLKSAGRGPDGRPLPEPAALDSE